MYYLEDKGERRVLGFKLQLWIETILNVDAVCCFVIEAADFLVKHCEVSLAFILMIVAGRIFSVLYWSFT